MGGGVSRFSNNGSDFIRWTDIESSSSSTDDSEHERSRLRTAFRGVSKKVRKLSIKKKSRNYARVKSFVELIKDWPRNDVLKLLKEFDADEYLFTLQEMYESSRRHASSFRDDFDNSRNWETCEKLIYKDVEILIHKEFILQRCKKMNLNETGVLQNSFSGLSTEYLRKFIDWCYNEKWDDDHCLLEKYRKEFGCTKTLYDDCIEKQKKDFTKGDLCIIVMSSETATKKETNFKFYCDSHIISSRSKIIRNLLSRNNGKELTFCDDIFPRSYANVFIHFLYTDNLDLSLVSSSDITLSSLSQAKAIISGKSPDIQLHRALQLIEIARFFSVEKLVQSCEDVVVKYLNVQNCIAVYQWARDGGSKYVERKAKRMIENEFSKIIESSNVNEITESQLIDLLKSQFIQASELEILETCMSWGEYQLLKKLEECEPNVVADTCHSISRTGLRESDFSNGNLRKIVLPLTEFIRKDYVLPPFHQSLTEAYNRHILERAPLPVDLIVCETTSEINPDLHWLRMPENSSGPRYYKPYHVVLRKRVEFLGSTEDFHEGTERTQGKISNKLVIENKYPDILEESRFLMVKNRITAILGEADCCEKIDLLPRNFHKQMAIELITKRVLTEMDVDEDLIISYYQVDDTNNGDPTGKSDSIPDVLLGEQ